MTIRAKLGLFVWVIQVLIEDLGHGEHMDPILLKHSAHRVVAADLASIAWILQLFFTDVLPYLFDSLGARQLEERVSIGLACDLGQTYSSLSA